jgi:LacI family transcriptional regulator
VKSKSEGIGLVVRGVGNPFYTQIIHAVERAIDAAGYTLVLHQISTDDDEIMAGASLARAKKLRGLIFLGGKGDYQSSDIEILNVPFVCCTYTVRFTPLPRESYSSVAIDDKMEGYRATRFLLENGHRKIGVIINSKHDRSIGELRYMGYCQALEEAGIALDETLLEEAGAFSLSATYKATQRLLERRSDLTAIFTYSDSMAVAVAKAVGDMGRRVPEDCSLIAIDGLEISSYFVPVLTTMVQPQTELGTTAVQTLIDMVEGRTGNRHILLPAKLRVGGSVRTL